MVILYLLSLQLLHLNQGSSSFDFCQILVIPDLVILLLTVNKLIWPFKNWPGRLLLLAKAESLKSEVDTDRKLQHTVDRSFSRVQISLEIALLILKFLQSFANVVKLMNEKPSDFFGLAEHLCKETIVQSFYAHGIF